MGTLILSLQLSRAGGHLCAWRNKAEMSRLWEPLGTLRPYSDPLPRSTPLCVLYTLDLHHLSYSAPSYCTSVSWLCLWYLWLDASIIPTVCAIARILWVHVAFTWWLSGRDSASLWFWSGYLHTVPWSVICPLCLLDKETTARKADLDSSLYHWSKDVVRSQVFLHYLLPQPDSPL